MGWRIWSLLGEDVGDWDCGGSDWLVRNQSPSAFARSRLVIGGGAAASTGGEEGLCRSFQSPSQSIGPRRSEGVAKESSKQEIRRPTDKIFMENFRHIDLVQKLFMCVYFSNQEPNQSTMPLGWHRLGIHQEGPPAKQGGASCA